MKFKGVLGQVGNQESGLFREEDHDETVDFFWNFSRTFLEFFCNTERATEYY